MPPVMPSDFATRNFARTTSVLPAAATSRLRPLPAVPNAMPLSTSTSTTHRAVDRRYRLQTFCYVCHVEISLRYWLGHKTIGRRGQWPIGTDRHRNNEAAAPAVSRSTLRQGRWRPAQCPRSRALPALLRRRSDSTPRTVQLACSGTTVADQTAPEWFARLSRIRQWHRDLAVGRRQCIRHLQELVLGVRSCRG